MRGFPILTVMSGGRPPLLPRCGTRNEEQASSTTADVPTSTQGQGARGGAADRPRQYVVEEEITVQVPLVRPKPGLLQILQAAGARGEIFTEREICCHLKDYIRERRLYDPMDPSVVYCHSDPLGLVLGVQRFTVYQVLELLKNVYNRVPDTCIKRKRHLVARSVEGQQLSTSTATISTSSATTTTTAAHTRTAATTSANAPTQQMPVVHRGASVTAASVSGLSRPPSISSTTNPGPGPSLHPASQGQAGARGQKSGSPCQGTSGTSNREGQRKSRKRHRNKSTSSESADQGGPPVRKRRTSVNLSYETDKDPCDSWCLKVSVETSDSEPGTGVNQEKEGAVDEGGWVVEGDSISLEYESDAFSVEYEVASSSGDATSLSSLSVDVPEEGLLVVCKDSDMEFWADYSDTESDADREITEEDKWLCYCGHRSLPWQRNCSFCWNLRPDWLPDRNNSSLHRRLHKHHSRYFLSSSDGSDTPAKQLEGMKEPSDTHSQCQGESAKKGDHSTKGDHPVKLSSHCSKQGMPRPTALYPGAKPLGRPDQDLSSSESSSSSSSSVSVTSLRLEERCRKLKGPMMLDHNCNHSCGKDSPMKADLPGQRSEVNGGNRPAQSVVMRGEERRKEEGIVKASARSSFCSFSAMNRGMVNADSVLRDTSPALPDKDSSAFEVLPLRVPHQHEHTADISKEVPPLKSPCQDTSGGGKAVVSGGGKAVVSGGGKAGAVPSLPELHAGHSTSAAAFLEARDEVDGDLSAANNSSRASDPTSSSVIFHIASVMGQGVLNKPSSVLASSFIAEVSDLHFSSPGTVPPQPKCKESTPSIQVTPPESASVSGSQSEDKEAMGSLQESMSLDLPGDDTDSGVVLSTLSSQESLGMPFVREDVVTDSAGLLVGESRLNRPLHPKDSPFSATGASDRQQDSQNPSGSAVHAFSSPRPSQASHSSVPRSPSPRSMSRSRVLLPSPRILGEPSTSHSASQSTDLCVVCMMRPKTGSIVHGSSGHQVCCFKCAKRLKRKGKHCPVCRRPIQKVIRNFIL